MRFHCILNAFTDDIEKQALEIRGFINQSSMNISEGNTIIISDGKRDGDDRKRLADMAPTNSVIFVLFDNNWSELALQYLMDHIDFEDLYLFGSNSFGQELAVRMGKRSDGASLIGALSLDLQENMVYVQKMVYANHMIATFSMEKTPVCISVSKSCFEEVKELDTANEKMIEIADLTNTSYKQWMSDTQSMPKEKMDGLATADFVLLGGRGMRSKEGTETLKSIAEHIHAEFGVSRPVAMNAWAPMNQLVGVSGAMIHPKLCIAAGVSGAAALYAGIEKSEFIIAINQDESAPIMKKADVCIQGDCQEILMELEACVKEGES